MKIVHTMMLSLLLLVVATLNAQTTTVTDNNAKAREVGPFTGVKVSTGIELLLQQGDKDALAVSCNKPEYLDKIKTVVEGNLLKIYIEHSENGWNWRKNVKFKAYVSIRQLEKLQASSGASVKTGSEIQVNNLDMDISSGAIVEGSFKGGHIQVDNSSGAVTTLKGSVETLRVESSSGAMFKGFDLVSVQCNADASSGGMIRVTVNKELEAEATSGGMIQYKGDGVIRKLNTSSGGSVKSNG